MFSLDRADVNFVPKNGRSNLYFCVKRNQEMNLKTSKNPNLRSSYYINIGFV